MPSRNRSQPSCNRSQQTATKPHVELSPVENKKITPLILEDNLLRGVAALKLASGWRARKAATDTLQRVIASFVSVPVSSASSILESALTPLLTTRDWKVRRIAWRLVEDGPAEFAINIARQHRGAPQEGARREALSVLARLAACSINGANTLDAAEVLLEGGLSPTMRVRTLDLISEHGFRGDDVALAGALESLEDSDGVVRLAACEAVLSVASVGHAPSIAKLLHASKGGQPRERLAALAATRHLLPAGDIGAASCITDFLGDTDRAVRLLAVQTIRKTVLDCHQDKRGTSKLRSCLWDCFFDASRWVRLASKTAMRDVMLKMGLPFNDTCQLDEAKFAQIHSALSDVLSKRGSRGLLARVERGGLHSVICDLTLRLEDEALSTLMKALEPIAHTDTSISGVSKAAHMAAKQLHAGLGGVYNLRMRVVNVCTVSRTKLFTRKEFKPMLRTGTVNRITQQPSILR